MSQQNVFIPKAYQPVEEDSGSDKVQNNSSKKDNIGSGLVSIARITLVFTAFLVPLFFTPGLYATLGFDKFILALIAVLFVIVVLSLATLRSKRTETVVPLTLGLFWLFVIGSLISAALSGDMQDAVSGSGFGIQTVGFVALMALLMSAALVLQKSKKMCLYVMTGFSLSALILIVYNLLRFIAGPILPVGSFGNITISPIGGLNDLAVFSTVTLVVSLITLLQLPLKTWMKGFLSLLAVGSLGVLIVANFFFLWIITGFLSLLLLIYLLARDNLFKSEDFTEESGRNFYLLFGLTLLITLVSAGFVIAGDYFGAKVNSFTDLTYIEVRPSLDATLDMATAVYQEDFMLGTGPNRFSDAWRQNKDLSINQTNFWNVDFQSGFGLVSTIFVTTGLLGGILLVAFHLAFAYSGYRMLLQNETRDQFWYYFGCVTFVASALLWGISYIYVPGASVLLMTALFTGLTFVAYGALMPSKVRSLALTTNRRRGFFLMTLAVIVVVLSMAIIFVVIKQYAAESNYNRAVANAESIEEFEKVVERAYLLYPNNRFLNGLSQLKAASLQQMLGISEPTEADQSMFVATAEQAILLSEQAISLDPTDPTGYSILANIYYTLAAAELEGAGDRAKENLNKARSLDPLDPSYALLAAVAAARSGDYETARTEIQNALNLKRNYTDALFLLSQIEIQQGNVESAINSTRQIVTLEPNNPTRYYQLGILLAANNQTGEAIEAYQVALALDDQFANARYMLAMALVKEGQSELALEQLRIIAQSNQDNQQLRDIINELETTGTISAVTSNLETPVSESLGGEVNEDGVVTDNPPETDVVTPINTEPATETES